MSTALGLGAYPFVRDDIKKMNSMSGFPGLSSSSHVRRPSASSAAGSNGSSSSHHHHHHQQPSVAILSTLEDSGNINNRGLLQHSSSHHRGHTSHSDRDTSTCVHTGHAAAGTGAGLQQATTGSTGSLKQQQQQTSLSTSQRTAANNDSYDANSDAGDRVVEEKRKRSNGNGYSTHRYTIGRLLGKGGFAKVYLCTAMDTGKNYAVKVVPKANLVKARAQQKLQAEIKIHRTLKHRHICQFKHYFEDHENCYILLELCHNQSLNEMIKRRKRLTEPEAAYFMKQLLEATRYMHDVNVIHRDLKLGNLFIDKDMHMKVGDLGLATRVEDRDEKRKTICGTPNYIAPEIIQGDKSKRGHSFEVDVWSMGVILYTVLIGKPPYEAKDVKATYQRILNNEYSFPRHVDISPCAKSLIKSMLQSQPSDRPTLDEIDAHPFLTDLGVPTFLPTSVLSIAPVWRINEYGDHVCTDKVPDYMSGKKPAIPRSNSFSARRPFSSHDPNTQKAASTTTTVPRKVDINLERVAKTAAAAMSGGTSNSDRSSKHRGQLRHLFSSSSTTPAFEIFDESQSQRKPAPAVVADEMSSRDELDTAVQSRIIGKRQTPPQPTLTEEMLCQQTRALSIQSPLPRQNSVVASSVFTQNTESVFSSNDNDAEIFKLMIDHLDSVLNVVESRKASYRAAQLRSMSPRFGPSKWVSRYVDYTCKYGLGFLLNDGSSGVYFNDSTKTALDRQSDTFQYIERKRCGDVQSPKLRGETVIETHTLNKYPDNLKKKVTLLKHFRNYLLQQQMDDNEVEDVPAELANDGTNGQFSADLVYVKKWVRTKHAILFSLSDRTIQVIFYDQTEILLTPDISYLTHVDKQRKRFTYHFTDELVGASAEIEKRLRYTKDIMLQLLASGQKN